jgi:3-deoxy-D-manno-octulosonate 8-phosphate phosphatase (KDO 8-P phosphatase)
MNTIDPMLAERASKIRLVALDVDGVLTDGKLYFDSAGNELKAFNTADGLGLKSLQKYGIRLAIITGRESPMVTQRAAQLGIELVYQGSENKLTAYMDLLHQTGLEAEQVCFAGDDWIDLPVLTRVGLAVTVPGADQQVKDRVHWVSSRDGGDGAVRELCDLILKAQGHYELLLEEILSQ